MSTTYRHIIDGGEKIKKCSLNSVGIASKTIVQYSSVVWSEETAFQKYKIRM